MTITNLTSPLAEARSSSGKDDVAVLSGVQGARCLGPDDSREEV